LTRLVTLRANRPARRRRPCRNYPGAESLAGLLLCTATVYAAADPAASLARVELSIAVEPGAPLQVQQQWSQLLADLKLASVRLYQGFENQPSIDRRGGAPNARVRITGSLSASGQLTLPGRRFSSRDRTALHDWLIEQVDGPKPSVPAISGTYELSPEHSRSLRSALAAPLESATAEIPLRDAVGRARATISLPVEFSPAAETALESAPACQNELQGLAVGTALAALLRTAQLGFVPSTDAGALTLRVARLDELKTPWPVGTRARAPREDLPRFFDSLDAELDNVPVRRALTAITGKLEIPLVLDQARLTELKLNLDQMTVSVRGRSWVYSLLIREIARQSRLRCDLHLDDAQRPFLWVTAGKL